MCIIGVFVTTLDATPVPYRSEPSDCHDGVVPAITVLTGLRTDRITQPT